MRRLSKMHLLQNVGKKHWLVSKVWQSKVIFLTILYSGKENETFVSTRRRLYKNQTYKSSSRLIPDTDSTDEPLKRADLQTFLGGQCMENIIEYPDPIDRGWQASAKGLCPVWFGSEELPTLITDKSQNMKTGRSMFHKYK